MTGEEQTHSGDSWPRTTSRGRGICSGGHTGLAQQLRAVWSSGEFCVGQGSAEKQDSGISTHRESNERGLAPAVTEADRSQGRRSEGLRPRGAQRVGRLQTPAKGRRRPALRVCTGDAALRHPEVPFWPLELGEATQREFPAPGRAVTRPMFQQ